MIIRMLMFALAIALGLAVPRPAQAEGGEAIVGVIAGIAALAIIAKAIEDNKEEEEARARAQRATRFHDNPNATRLHRHGHQSRIYRSDRVLPDQCFRTIETRDGIRRVFGQRCLQRNGVNTARLPSTCAFQVRTYRGIRTVYAGRCLRQNGWVRNSVAANR